MPVKGIAQVKRNYKALTEKISGKRTEVAVAAILSQGGSMAATMTPIHTSTLINSHFVDIYPSNGKVIGRTGYTASYASAVHDAPGKLKGESRPDGSGNYWDPNAEPGFLTKGFEEIKPSIPAILRRAYRDK